MVGASVADKALRDRSEQRSDSCHELDMGSFLS